MNPYKDEARISYLMRVLREFMENTCAGEETIFYDGAECDGFCLADDIVNCLEFDHGVDVNFKEGK